MMLVLLLLLMLMLLLLLLPSLAGLRAIVPAQSSYSSSSPFSAIWSVNETWRGIENLVGREKMAGIFFMAIDLRKISKRKHDTHARIHSSSCEIHTQIYKMMKHLFLFLFF
jgi:hypothetical protein